MTPGPESITFEVSDSPRGARIFKLAGPLTIKTLFDFQDRARQETEKSIVIDLSGVPYMDSAGLGCVVSVFTSCQRHGCGFAIAGLNDRIKTLFVVTHVDGLLPCFETLEQADAAASKS